MFYEERWCIMMAELERHDDLVVDDILGDLGCALIRREGQRFFSSLVNEPHQPRWAAAGGARSILPFVRLVVL
jgi:hypothetical protein